MRTIAGSFEYFSVYNILKPELLFGANFTQIKLCAMYFYILGSQYDFPNI